MEHAQGVEQPPAPVAAPAASARRRKQYEDEALTRSVARVVEGGEKAALVSREAGIPYRTLAKYVRRARAGQSLARRRTGPPPVLAASGERALLDWMRALQRRRLPVRRRELMARANELAREGGAAEQLSAGWYKRFRQRHPEISGSSADLVVGGDEEREQAELEQETTTGEHETQSEDDDGEQQAPSTAELQQQQQQQQQQQPPQQQPQQQQQQQQPEQQLPRLRLEELSPMERAVLVVQDQYAGRMPAADVVEAFDVMLDPVKARVFLVMTAGDGRDLWLRKQVARSRQEASTS